MVDRETREKILRDKTLPIHRKYNGIYNRKDILECLLMGYGIQETVEELGVCKATVENSVKKLREHLGYDTNRQMLRGLVKRYRGYL